MKTSFPLIPAAQSGALNYPDGNKIKVEYSGSGLSVTSITRSGSTATVTTANNHNLAAGTTVTIAGASQAEYNITATISNVTANTFDYEVTGTPATPATGTVTYSFTNVQQESTVNATSFSIDTLTITLDDSILPDTNVTVDAVFYSASPPVFRHIYKAHDRLWALAGGCP